MVRFTIFGIPVIIEPFFWITLGILGVLSSSSGAYGTTPQALLEIALFVIAGFISILVHELGHALTARKFGAHCQIVLQSFGGFARYAGVQMSRLQSFLITAAGPLAQIALAIIIGIIIWQAPKLTDNAQYFLHSLLWISLIWSIFNLFPILPLDGGRMVESILGPQRLKITLWISLISAIGLGLILLLLTRSIIAPIFLGMFAWQSWKALQQLR